MIGKHEKRCECSRKKSTCLSIWTHDAHHYEIDQDGREWCCPGYVSLIDRMRHDREQKGA